MPHTLHHCYMMRDRVTKLPHMDCAKPLWGYVACSSSSSVLSKLQGYREAHSLVLGLGKEARLRYKVKMLKGVKPWP